MGKCFWNTEVHVYMETSGSDARSLFEKRCVSSEMTSCTCCMQKLAAAGRIQQGMCTWKLIVLMQASKQREDRNLLQVELARIHTADTQPVLPHRRSCSSKAI